MSKKAAVYTRTGDKGTTGLYTGERVSKCSVRVESYGNLDEITSALGLARSLVKRDDVKETIFNVQKLLMSMMADVASLNLPQPYITEDHVKIFESTIDKFDAMLQPLNHFIIPGDTPGAAALDIARTTTRKPSFRLVLHPGTCGIGSRPGREIIEVTEPNRYQRNYKSKCFKKNLFRRGRFFFAWEKLLFYDIIKQLS